MSIETERRKRINVSLWAYAYEIMDDPIVSDSKFDEVCRQINPQISTGNQSIDIFFATEFNPHTGVWIYKHPDTEGLRKIYSRLQGKTGKSVPIYKNEAPPITQDICGEGFKTHIEMKIYLASLGFNVLGGIWTGSNLGTLEFEFDTDFFHVTQKETGITKSIAYSEWVLGK